MGSSKPKRTNEATEHITADKQRPSQFMACDEKIKRMDIKLPDGLVTEGEIIHNADAFRLSHWYTRASLCFYVTGKYFFDSKVFRAVVLVAATLCTAYVCLLSSQRYFNSWVQTVIDRTDVHISEIPFPAVTICPVKGISLSRIQKAKEMLLGPNGTTGVNAVEFERLVRLLGETMWLPSSNASKVSGNDQFNFGLELDAIDLSTLVQSLAYDCHEVFADCMWLYLKVSCCNIFRTIGTYKGICYSFNSVLVDDPNPHWPWTINVAGLNHGLKVALNKQVHDNGFELIAAMVHSPSETFSSTFDFLDGDRVFFSVSPLRFTADPDIHTLMPHKRRCYFTSELEAMGRTKTECLRDCRLKYIEQKCNCTLYIQHQGTNAEHRLCRPSDMTCIYDHRNVLLTTGNYIEDLESNGEFNIIDCKCYPNCNYVQYSSSIHADTVNTQSNGSHFDLHVYYQQETLFSYRSVLRFTLLDLIVSYGGIAGLFLGFSLVGIIKTLQQCVLHWKRRSQDREEDTEAKKSGQAK